MEDECTSLPFCEYNSKEISLHPCYFCPFRTDIFSCLLCCIKIKSLLVSRKWQNIELLKPGQSDEATTLKYCPEVVLPEEIEEGEGFSQSDSDEDIIDSVLSSSSSSK